MRYAITRRLTAALLLFLSFSASAQGIGETERLRLENIYLRQKNDSLAHELRLLQEETVFVLWDALSGLSPDRDAEYDYSGFGLMGEKLETDFMRKVMSTVPFFRMSYNDIFEKYIDLYTVSRKKSMPYVLGRYYKYLPRFRAAFRLYGVPEDLAALCIVESAVSRKALSKAGAYGIWQLMPDTARRYGLIVNETVDQRLDIFLATDAAAQLLRDLKRSLGGWELALLAYNCGSGNVRKAIIRSGGSSSVWDIYEYLPAETRAYLPSYVGALFCEKFHDEYNIAARAFGPDPFEPYTVRGDRTIADIARLTGADPETLAEMNCHYIRGIVPAGMNVYIPKGKSHVLKENNY